MKADKFFAVVLVAAFAAGTIIAGVAVWTDAPSPIHLIGLLFPVVGVAGGWFFLRDIGVVRSRTEQDQNGKG